MRKTAAVLALLLFAVPAGVYSLGLGEIEVFSALNEPLSARIPLRSATPGAFDEMNVGLATREQFARTGLDRPFVLSKLKFALVPDDSGSGHIQITTKEPIAEPFLNFLVEVEWPQGTIVREYTLLLDPPVYGAAMASAVEQAMSTVDGSGAQPPAVTEAKPQTSGVEPAVPEPVSISESIAVSEPVAVVEPVPAVVAEPVATPNPAPVVMPDPEPFAQRPATEPKVVTMTLAEALGLSEAIYASPPPSATTIAPASPSGDAVGSPNYGPVSSSDTLWSLANSLRPSASLSIQQTMLAILKNNPDAFVSDNVNSLMAGAVLRVPTREEIEAVSAAEALAEVKKQYAQWDEYRQVVATDVPSTPEGAAAQVADQTTDAAPDVQTSLEGEVEDSEPSLEARLGEEVSETSTDSSRVELLSAGSATEGEGLSAGEQARLEQLTTELDLTLEQVDAQRRENAEISSRLTEVESLVGDLERLVALKDDSIAALQSQLAEREAELAAQALVLEQAQAERFESEATGQSEEALATPAGEAAVTPDEEVPPTLDEEGTDVEAQEDALLAELERELAALDEETMVEPSAEVDLQPPPATVDEPIQAELDTEPMVEEQPAGTEEVETETAPVAGGVGATAPVQIEEQPAQGGQLAAPTAAPRQVTRESTSMLHKVMSMVPGNPLYIGGGLVGLLVLVLGLVLARKKRQQPDAVVLDAAALADDPLVDELTAENALVAGEETAAPVSEEETAAVVDEEPATADVLAEEDEQEEDPLEGVNIYLAYERYDEAADMVRGVIKNFPEKSEYRLRLVEIFYAARNAASFEIAARELQDVVGPESPMMEKARAWWSEMTPGHALFEQPAEQPPSETAGETDDGVFDFTEGSQLSPDDMTMEILLDESNETNDDTGTVDFDLGLDEGSETGEGDISGDVSIDFEIGEGDESEDHGTTGLDFTLEDATPGASADATTADPQDNSVDLDVGQDDSQTVPVPMAEAAGDDDSIEFDLDFTAESDAQGTGTEEVSEETIDFALDLDETTEPSGSDDGDDETGLTLILDASDEPAAVDDEMQALLGDGEDDDTVIDFSLDADEQEAPVVELADPALAEDDDLGEDGRETHYMLRDVPPVEGSDDSLDLTIDTDADLGEELDFNLEPNSDLERTKVSRGADVELEPSAEERSGEFDTVRLSVNQLEDVSALKSDDSTLTELQPDSLEVDGEFVDVFDDTGEVGDSAEFEDTAGFAGDVFDVGEELPDSAASEDNVAMTHEQAEATQFMLRDIEAMSSDSALDDEEQRRTLVLGRQPTGEIDEMQTKLDLAQAYIDMGDTDGARGILGEVIADGSDTQKQQAGELLSRLG